MKWPRIKTTDGRGSSFYNNVELFRAENFIVLFILYANTQMDVLAYMYAHGRSNFEAKQISIEKKSKYFTFGKNWRLYLMRLGSFFSKWRSFAQSGHTPRRLIFPAGWPDCDWAHCLLWAYFWKLQKSPKYLGYLVKVMYALIVTKAGWALLWAICLQTHQVTLLPSDRDESQTDWIPMQILWL
jgi:hypothetical protein